MIDSLKRHIKNTSETRRSAISKAESLCLAHNVIVFEIAASGTAARSAERMRSIVDPGVLFQSLLSIYDPGLPRVRESPDVDGG